MNAGDSPHEGRLCDCVFECVGECDCESGSAKRIFACVVAVSPLPHVNRRRRGSQAVEWERVPSQLGGATPPLSSLIMAHQKKKKEWLCGVCMCPDNHLLHGNTGVQEKGHQSWRAVRRGRGRGDIQSVEETAGVETERPTQCCCPIIFSKLQTDVSTITWRSNSYDRVRLFTFPCECVCVCVHLRVDY